MPKRSKGRAGNTIPDAAKKLRMGPGQLRRAIDNGEVNYVEFAGLKRIPDEEIKRIAALLGLSIEPVEASGTEDGPARSAAPVGEQLTQPIKARPAKPAARGTKAPKSAQRAVVSA